jgi:hypothetical protein
MDEHRKEVWSGVVLALYFVMTMLVGLLVLRLTGN